MVACSAALVESSLTESLGLQVVINEVTEHFVDAIMADDAVSHFFTSTSLPACMHAHVRPCRQSPVTCAPHKPSHALELKVRMVRRPITCEFFAH